MVTGQYLVLFDLIDWVNLILYLKNEDVPCQVVDSASFTWELIVIGDCQVKQVLSLELWTVKETTNSI